MIMMMVITMKPCVRLTLLALLAATFGSGVWAFCPAGGDVGMNIGRGHDDPRWKCAVGRDPEDGEMLFDEDCVEAVEEDLRAQRDDEDEDETECDAYWGDDGVSAGLWDQLTGQIGQNYWSCYSSFKENSTEWVSPAVVSKWSQAKFFRERKKIDHFCVEPRLCELEHDSQGWCSKYFLEKVAPSCGQDPYRDIFCSEICPPPKRAAVAEPPVSFTEFDGFISSGGKLLADSMTLAEAKVKCSTIPECKGFSYRGEPGTLAIVRIYLKSKFDINGEGTGSGWTSYRRDSGEASEKQKLRQSSTMEQTQTQAFSNAYQEEEMESEEKTAPWMPRPKQSKCPVKRAAFFVKEKAVEIGSKALKWVESILPAMLAPPSPMPAASDSDTAAAPAKEEMELEGAASPLLASPVPIPSSLR